MLGSSCPEDFRGGLKALSVGGGPAAPDVVPAAMSGRPVILGEWLLPILVIVAAAAFAFALPIGLPARLALVCCGLGLGLLARQGEGALHQDWRDALTLAGAVAGVEPNPNEGQSAPSGIANSNDQVTVTYKVTATVRVNGELRSGSSLQQVTIRRNITFGLQAASNTTARAFGESVAVPIVDDAYLLVTMLGRDSYEGVLVSPCRDLREDRQEPPSADEILSNAANFSGSCALAPERLPSMLAVKDIEQPTGFIRVSPADLSAAFGVNAEFVSLEFARTDDPLRYRLQDQLRWINSLDSDEYKFGIELQTNNGRRSFFSRADILIRETK